MYQGDPDKHTDTHTGKETLTDMCSVLHILFVKCRVFLKTKIHSVGFRFDGAECLAKGLTEGEVLAAVPGRENRVPRAHAAWGPCCKGTMKMTLELSSPLTCGSQHCLCQLAAGCLTFNFFQDKEHAQTMLRT